VPLFGWMLEGELTVAYQGAGASETQRTYRPGDALMEAIDTPHNGRNAGPAPVRILAVFLGAEGVGNSETVE
jgi:quercetin dioxygenase-like cupin family protein